MRPVFILCEGDHDIALIGPLLEAAGAKPFKSSIKDYPSGLSVFLSRRYGMRNVNEARFHAQSPLVKDALPVLAAAYEYKSTLFLFFLGGGDAQHEAVRGFFTSLVDMASSDTPMDMRVQPFGVIFVRDADQVGVHARISELKKQYGDIVKSRFPSFDSISSESAIWDNEYSFGACIFVKADQDAGALEHVIESVMRSYFSQRWDAATAWLEAHTEADSKLGRMLIKWPENPNKIKAILTICGQPDQPSYSQNVILRDLLRGSPHLVAQLLEQGPIQKIQRLILDSAEKTSDVKGDA